MILLLLKVPCHKNIHQTYPFPTSNLHFFLPGKDTADTHKATSLVERVIRAPSRVYGHWLSSLVWPNPQGIEGWVSLGNKIGNKTALKVHSHRYECVHTGSSKHEFACISTAAVHIDTSSVRSVRVTCEFHSYEEFLCRSCFYPTRMKRTTQNLY